MTPHLEHHGWDRLAPGVPRQDLDALHELFAPGSPGTRCLLDEPRVRRLAILIGRELEPSAPPAAIQAIAFDKTPDVNWKVPWHQDLMFPLAAPAGHPDYALGSTKDDIPYARPPLEVLEQLLAVRLHLDPCGAGNGPLRLAPGSHRHGIIPSDRVAGVVASGRTLAFHADPGEALLMRPLLLHASSKAGEPGHRRVLHLVYHLGPEPPEPWHRSIR